MWGSEVIAQDIVILVLNGDEYHLHTLAALPLAQEPPRHAVEEDGQTP